jgi:linoleate 10R-lipoxygenase
MKADTEDEILNAFNSHKIRSNFVKGRNNIENLLAYSEPSHESWAEYFREEVEALITEKAIRHDGDNSRYVDVVGDVINLVPVRWISENIVSASTYPMQS